MDYKYIQQLLERYWQGETSLEEEQILRAFFSQTDVPAELQKYCSLFIYEQSETRTDVLGKDFDDKMMAMIADSEPVKARVISFRQSLTPLFKAAAVVAIILTPHRCRSTATAMRMSQAPGIPSMERPWPSVIRSRPTR